MNRLHYDNQSSLADLRSQDSEPVLYLDNQNFMPMTYTKYSRRGEWPNNNNDIVGGGGVAGSAGGTFDN